MPQQTRSGQGTGSLDSVTHTAALDRPGAIAILYRTKMTASCGKVSKASVHHRVWIDFEKEAARTLEKDIEHPLDDRSAMRDGKQALLGTILDAIPTDQFLVSRVVVSVRSDDNAGVRVVVAETAQRCVVRTG